MPTLPRILLVEDDPADLHLAMAVFAELQMSDQIFAVSDGAEAAEFLEMRGRYQTRPPGNPSLVLLDLKIPLVDGLELLAFAKAHPLFRLIPFVCLTSSRNERDVRRAYELGVNGYVVKTIDYGDFASALKSLADFWVMANEPPPGSLPRPKAPSIAEGGMAPLQRPRS